MKRCIACLLLVTTFAQAAPAQVEEIFSDAFESGDFCAWSQALGATEPYGETFTLPDGSAWPAPWSAIGSVALADVQAGRARFRPTPSGYSLARLFAPVATREVEVQFTVVFEDVASQGVGFYVRQNGGYLQQSSPQGQGYAVFLEGFRGQPAIGVWREINGQEQEIEVVFDAALNYQNQVPYRVRFRVTQMNASTTLLQAKIWPEGQAEPVTWRVTATDQTPQLQGISGGIALDSWSAIVSPNPITSHTLVDDIEVQELCNPLAGRGPLEVVGNSFQFTEGPIWRSGRLLFSDIDASTIYSLEPPSTIEVLRQPSGGANGLGRRLSGDDVFACEHQTRRVSVTNGAGITTTVVGTFGGLSFNSPNDLIFRRDGTLYFTDPPYGMAMPGDRELSFNGLFRLDPQGTLTAEWQGVVDQNGPNGVALSPQEDLLYVTDSETGEVLVFDIAANGALSGRRTFFSGLTIPDGLCIDPRGNLFVATWASTVEVMSPEGEYWGAIITPQQATNCAFGGDDLRTLYITGQTGLYRVRLGLPGLP